MPQHKTKSKRRRLLRLLLCLFLLFVVGVLTLPFYWGYVLKALLNSSGLRYSAYERVSYSRFILEGVEFRKDDAPTIRASVVEAPMPWAFILKQDRHISIEGWEVILANRSKPDPKVEAPLVSIHQSIADFFEAYGTYRHYVDTLRMHHGIFKYGDASTSIESMLLASDRLTVGGIWEKEEVPFVAIAEFEGRSSLSFHLDLVDRDISLQSHLLHDQATSSLRGDVLYENQPFSFFADWAGDSLLPVEAGLRAEAIRISNLKLLDELSLSEDPILNLNLSWAGDSWSGHLKAFAESNANGAAVPISAEAQVSGTLKTVTVSRLLLEAEGSRAELESPLTLDFSTLAVPQGATFSLRSDLSAQSFLPLKGLIQGTVEITKSESEGFPELGLMLSGEALSYLDFNSQRVEINTRLKWPYHSGRIRVSGAHYTSYAVDDLSASWEAMGTDFTSFVVIADSTEKGISGQVEGAFNYRPDEALAFDVVGAAVIDIQEHAPLEIDFKCMTNDQSIRLQSLEIQQDKSEVLRAQGHFPLVIYPGKSEPFKIASQDAAFLLQLQAKPERIVNEILLEETAWRVRQPELYATLEGTPRSPTGQIEFLSERIVPPPEDTPQLVAEAKSTELSKVRAMLSIDEGGLQVSEVSGYVLGRKIKGKGRFPLGTGQWRDLIKERRIPDWEKASGELYGEILPVSAFGAFVPDFLRAQGTVSGSLKLDSGKDLTAALKLTNGATYPLVPFGALRNIEAEIEIKNWIAKIRRLSATVSDKPLRVSGAIDFANGFDGPLYNLELTGDEIPLTRTSGLILRGSPNIRIQSESKESAHVSGSIVLKNSILTIDLADLSLSASSGAAGAARSAFPYFSVEKEPFKGWTLDVNIDGGAFMNVRTPGFLGKVSAGYNLTGTLGEPIAIGSFSVPQGSIRFPFAHFKVNHAEVSTTALDPFIPQVTAEAKSKVYGYDVTMEVEGSIYDPQVTFSSSPSLDSQSVLLMVTTGLIPSSEYTRTAGQRLSGIGLYLSKGILADLGLLDPSEDRLFIRTGEDISRTGRDTVEVEYQLDEKWSVEGSYDRFDTYNLDLGWKVFER